MQQIQKFIKSDWAIILGIVLLIVGVYISYTKFDQGWWDFFGGMIVGLSVVMIFGNLAFKYGKLR